uniref:Tantalus-like domain-containing protein n=2 Tax=Lutzomyia longipalpis TaxID=7200 RepID=A0A1B0CRI5_LUTLO
MNFPPTLISLSNDESYECFLGLKMSTLNLSKTNCDASSSQGPQEELPEDSLDCPGDESSSSSVRRSSRLGGRIEEKDYLHRIKRRTIMRPKRCVQPTTEKQIEAYYLNKKVVTKCTPLETIFEEPQIIKEKVALLGNRKFNRSIKFSDGRTTSKVTIQNRRKKIREVFGKAHKLKKVTMEYFLEHFTGVKATEAPPDDTNAHRDVPKA